MTSRALILFRALILCAVLLSGCGGNTPTPIPTSSNDLLSKILARGTIVVATDPAYPPQSELIPNARRAENSKCAPNEYTAAELQGFDISTAVQIANRLGVEPCFVTPQWGQLIVGNWDGRWDISVGSMAITPDRLSVLYFSQPYYGTPAAFFVHKDNNSISSAADLAGKKIGVCTGCTYDAYLQGSLEIPGQKIDFLVKNPKVFGYNVDTPALQDLALGDGVKLDAVLTAVQTGLQFIESGGAIKQVGDPVFTEYLAVAMDKQGNLSSVALALKITEIIQQMHADGTLSKLSIEYYGGDYATSVSKIDIYSFQTIP